MRVKTSFFRLQFYLFIFSHRGSVCLEKNHLGLSWKSFCSHIQYIRVKPKFLLMSTQEEVEIQAWCKFQVFSKRRKVEIEAWRFYASGSEEDRRVGLGKALYSTNFSLNWIIWLLEPHDFFISSKVFHIKFFGVVVSLFYHIFWLAFH